MNAIETLKEAGYNNEQIKLGADYANQQDWQNEEDWMAYAVARILYSDEQLKENPKYE